MSLSRVRIPPSPPVQVNTNPREAHQWSLAQRAKRLLNSWGPRGASRVGVLSRVRIPPSPPVQVNTNPREAHQWSLAQRAKRLLNSWVPASSTVVILCVVPFAMMLLAQASLVQRHATANHFQLPAILRASSGSATGNVLSNGGFESGKIDGGWIQCGAAAAYVTAAPSRPRSFAQYSGTRDGRSEPAGDSGVCQAVRIPIGAILTADLYQLSNEADTRFAYQEADLLDQRGNVVVNLYKAVNNAPRWVRGSWNLSGYAGNTYWLYFGVHGDGYGNAATQQFLDDVVLTGSAAPRTEVR